MAVHHDGSFLDRPPQPLLSEQELHAVGHARWQVERATPDDPECCFDYELVSTLIGVIDRLTKERI